jgi:hypothetical protein
MNWLFVKIRSECFPRNDLKSKIKLNRKYCFDFETLKLKPVSGETVRWLRFQLFHAHPWKISVIQAGPHNIFLLLHLLHILRNYVSSGLLFRESEWDIYLHLVNVHWTQNRWCNNCYPCFLIYAIPE